MGEAKKQTGRPTTYTDEIGERIAEAYGSGLLYRDIVKLDWAPTARTTIWDWMDQYPKFADRMSRAQVQHIEARVDDMDEVLKEDRDPQRARLRLDTIRWKASKFNAARFGDKLAIEVDHKVSIADALQAAQQRILRPMRDQHDTIEGQAVDITPQLPDASHDAGSSDVDEEPDFMG